MPPQSFSNSFSPSFAISVGPRRVAGARSNGPGKADRRQFIDAWMKASSTAASKLDCRAHGGTGNAREACD